MGILDLFNVKRVANPHREAYNKAKQRQREVVVRYRTVGFNSTELKEVRAGLDIWTKANPRLAFHNTPKHKATLLIRMSSMARSRRMGGIGVAIQKRRRFPYGEIRIYQDARPVLAETVAHEFGHIVGFGHTACGGLMDGVGDTTFGFEELETDPLYEKHGRTTHYGLKFRIPDDVMVRKIKSFHG